MTRPRIGTNPTLTQHESETYLDFVEGLFSYLRTIDPVATRRAQQAIDDYTAATGRLPQNVQETHAIVGGLPVMATRHRIRRDIQDMKYDAIIADLARREPELLAELDRYDRLGPGSVSYDRTMPIPDYTTQEIHLMPGGYVQHPLAGYWYQAGTKVFFMGRNDDDQIHQNGVDKLPLPADGQVRRILDIGCSSGQSATALKRRFPQAEVWGIDIGIPMVRYAHKRAVEMGIEVHFKQALAEDTGFPDGSFDIVHAFILYHELPLEKGEAVAREAKRLLRPGGLFLVTDFGTKHVKRGDDRGIGLVGEVYGDIDHRHNNEPYAWAFTHSDFEGMLRQHFANVEVRTEGYGMPLRVATRG